MSRYYLIILLAVYVTQSFADELQLNTGTAKVSTPNRVKFTNLKANGQFYNAEIEIHLDGNYSLINAEPSAATPVARYTVTLESTWSENSHPYMYPFGAAHLSGLIGATHNTTTRFWNRRELATTGIEIMAETGGKSALMIEIESAIDAGKANQVLSGGGIGSSPGIVEMSIEVDQGFPFITLVSMIAPSPDWFVGVSGLNLMKDGNWQNEIRVPLFAYDAGTDGGITYTSANTDSEPKEAIQRIEQLPFVIDDEIRPVGVMTFKRDLP